MKKESKFCKLLEKKALADKGAAWGDWADHSAQCPECKSRMAIVSRMNSAGSAFNASLGGVRFEEIRKAVAEREKPLLHYSFIPILKFAAVLIFVLGCCFFIRYSSSEKAGMTVRNDKPEFCLEKTDLTWEYVQDTESLKYRMNKLKRKVYVGDLENDDNENFNLKCKAIRNHSLRLKNAEQI